MANGKKTGGRKAGSLNLRTRELIELMGDYDPIAALLKIAKDKNTSVENRIKINLDLLPYLYPKRKSIDLVAEANITKPQTIEEVIEEIAREKHMNLNK